MESTKFYRLRTLGQFSSGVNGEKFIEAWFQEAIDENPIKSVRPTTNGKYLPKKINVRELPNLRVGSIYQGSDLLVRRHSDFGGRVKLDLDITKGHQYTLSDLLDLRDTEYYDKSGQLACKVWVFTKVPGVYERPYPGKSTLDIVIIPVYEIIRFYYSYTSNLVSALFNAGLHTKEIYDPELSHYSTNESGHNIAFVMLGKKIEDVCAKTVGRIIFDETAFKNAEMIHESLLEAKGFNVYPSSGFPFADKTQLLANYDSVLVKKTSKIFDEIPGIRKGELRVQIVTEILSCFHEMPFDGLDFLRINDARSILDKLDHEVKELPPAKRKKRKTNSSAEVDPKTQSDRDEGTADISQDEQRDKEVDVEIETLAETFDPFPNSQFKATKLDKDDQKTTRKLITEWINGIKQRTRGECETMGSGVLGVDAHLENNILDGDTERDFEDLVWQLNKNGIGVEDCSLNGGYGYSLFPMNKFKFKDDRIYEWCFVKKNIKRKCFLVECSSRSSDFFYLMDVQKRKNQNNEEKEHGFMVFFRNKEGNQISDHDLNEFLIVVALKKAVLKNFRNYNDDWEMIGIKHLDGDNAELRCERILSKIKL